MVNLLERRKEGREGGREVQKVFKSLLCGLGQKAQ